VHTIGGITAKPAHDSTATPEGEPARDTVVAVSYAVAPVPAPVVTNNGHGNGGGKGEGKDNKKDD
jgi:hypothetical protein